MYICIAAVRSQVNLRVKANRLLKAVYVLCFIYYYLHFNYCKRQKKGGKRSKSLSGACSGVNIMKHVSYRLRLKRRLCSNH